MSGLPIHFFTIVLNGEPFIRYHLDLFKSLPFAWHWHVVEGVAELKHDTAWSVAAGGRIEASFHDQGRSNDGTSAYLDEIAAAYPDRVTVYRRPLGTFWDGKLAMVRAPLANIREECLLWQVDADELWTAEQVVRCRELFQAHPEKRAAYYWCHFFVGPDHVLTTRDAYGNNSSFEWLRTWRFKPGDRWESHEPPGLFHRFERWRQWPRILQGKRLRPPFSASDATVFSHRETEAAGLVFQHLAYVIEAQLRFKEIYYGYQGAPERWRTMLAQDQFPIALKDYFPWVKDGAQVGLASTRGLYPILKTGD
ncbi:hypothetical protein GETHLI_10080 [Geothrix limicola]|uniref:Glycosyl transferase family 2 n=1 Tax=Geothrix limicola TaxID=2927978 RepID=A0ABQ5QDU4_9BACT|nr:hypothetical protein [Geothrix limicola]GLH72506.1 hypothetical protein GETHLI_10080 [Geothrix limicola]